MSEEHETPLNIISLESQNVCVLRAVRITPNGEPVITIGGANGAGKSTVLQSLEMALCGGRSIPKDPIRHGQRHASVKTVLGRNGEAELTIELDLAVASAPRLVVRDKDGKSIKTPQTVLNKLYEAIGFDPLEFSRYPKEKKAQIIKDLAGLNFEELDQRRTLAVEDRKNMNRDLKELDARLKAMPPESRDAPAEPVSIKDLAAALSLASTHNAARAAAQVRVDAWQTRQQEALSKVEALRVRLAEAERELANVEVEQRTAQEAFDALAPEMPLEPIQAALDSADETNKRVRNNHERKSVEDKIRDCEKSIAVRDAEIEKIDNEKLDMIAEAKFPVPGLSFDPEGGLLLNGTLLEQASDGQKLRLSVAIAIALHPKLGVILIRQGSLLDKAALHMIAEMARDAGVQVLIEMVTESPEGCTIFIEDGEVVRASATAAE